METLGTSEDKKKVDYITRKGIATTKQGHLFIIDHNAVIISDIPVAKEMIGKAIGTNRFEYQEPLFQPKIDTRISIAEEDFKYYCINNNIKYKSKTYYKYQHIYFNGCIAILKEVPAKWGICLMSSREIIEDYTVKSNVKFKQ